MKVLACSTIQYCDESFNGAEVICRWFFRERVNFLQNTQLQLESLPTVFQDQGERIFIAPCYDAEYMEQQNQ